MRHGPSTWRAARPLRSGSRASCGLNHQLSNYPITQLPNSDGPAGDERRRPRPLKIETSDSAVDVEHFAEQTKPRADARFHRGGIDLVERHSARGRLGVVVPATAADR